MKRPASLTAAILLWVIALAHLLRLVFGLEVTVDGGVIPLWISILPVLILGALGVWLWVERGR
jgi:lipopolysaccharide export LptBFGC system permease protein LptF